MVMDSWASALGLDLRGLPPFPDLPARATAPQPQGHLCAWPPCSCGCTAGTAVGGHPASGIPAFLSSCPIPGFLYPSAFSPAFIFRPQRLPCADWLLGHLPILSHLT